MDDLWFITEVQSVLNSSELKEPGDGHVIQVVHIKVTKMNVRACKKREGNKEIKKISEAECVILTGGREDNLPGPAMMAPPCWLKLP